jgi:hypothetical protein
MIRFQEFDCILPVNPKTKTQVKLPLAPCQLPFSHFSDIKGGT